MTMLPYYTEFEDNRGPGRPPKYPLRTMHIGETIFISNAITDNVCKAGHSIRSWNPMSVMRFKCRTICKGGIKGVKVTRVS